MVLHPHYYLLLHSQPRCLPHGWKDDHPDRERGGSSRADRNRIRNPRGWLYHDVLQGENSKIMFTSNVLDFFCYFRSYGHIRLNMAPKRDFMLRPLNSWELRSSELLITTTRLVLTQKSTVNLVPKGFKAGLKNCMLCIPSVLYELMMLQRIKWLPSQLLLITWGVQVLRYPNFFSREWKQRETWKVVGGDVAVL